MSLGHFGPIAPNKNEYDKNVFRTLREDFKARGIEYSLPLENSFPEVFCRKGVLRNFAKFTGKHLCQSLFFNKVAGLRSVTLLKKRLWHRCFPVNFAKFLRIPFLTEHLRWLLLAFDNLILTHFPSFHFDLQSNF